MPRSLSNLVDNLFEGLHDYVITKDEQLIFKCFECKKNYEKDFHKE